MEIKTAKTRCAVLGILSLAGIGLFIAQPGLAKPRQAETDPVRLVAAQEGRGSASTFQWANSLDLVARGLAKLLRDPAPLAILQARMAASPLPENTVRLADLLDAQVEGRGDRFGALLARQAGITEDKLRAALAAFPVPITLFFPREKDRDAVVGPGQGRGRLDLQVTWDGFWISQKNLRTLLAYDHTGKRTRYSVAAPPAGPVLVVSTENAAQPEAPRPAAETSAEVTPETTCFTPYLELTGVYLVDDHEGWPRGNPEFEIYLADWDQSMPGNQLLIQPTTPYQFSGRYVTDAAGRSRYLLDVNDEDRWYTFNPPIAMFAYNPYLGSGLYAVEDDDTAGVLKVSSGSYSIGFSCSYSPGCTGSQCLGCKPTGSGLVNLARAILGSGDDRYNVPFRSVGGAPLNTVMEVDMGDWRLRYRVACP